MADLAEISHDDWMKFFSFYDLGRLKSIHPDENDSYDHQLWQAITDTGAFSVVSLSRMTTGVSEKLACETNLILEKITKLEIDLPIIIPDKNGHLINRIRNSKIQVRKNICGNPFDYNDPLIFGSAGRLLATIQRELRSFDLNPAIDLSNVDDTNINGINWFSNQNADLMNLMSQIDLKNIVEQFTELASENRSELTSQGYWEFPSTITRTGFTGSNLLCNWHSVTGIQGFYYPSRDIRMLDITEAIVDFADPLKKSGRDLNLIAAIEFIKAYRQVSSLPDDELMILPNIQIGVKFLECVNLIFRTARSSEYSKDNLRNNFNSYLVEINFWREEGKDWIERLIENCHE